MSKAKIDDVAKLAGFSIKTVSRVINNEPNVREATRAKVEEAIAELNYRPNLSARNLASHHSHLIALIYDDPSAYEIPSAGYIIRMQQGALRACGALGYELLKRFSAVLSQRLEQTRFQLLDVYGQPE